VRDGSAIFDVMMRKQRGRAASDVGAGAACAVCGMADARGLTSVDLSGGMRVTLCGSHELMHRRDGGVASSLAELRAAFSNRRGPDRRGTSRGEVDELAEKLSDAFRANRRASDRRAS
jgi:hypothetical protein